MSKFENKPNHIVKDDSGKAHWISRSLATVTTIILNNEKVLLVKRGSKISSPNKWCNPCGYLDWNESATQCAMREVFEETGLDITEISEENIEFNMMKYPYDIVTNPTLNYNQDVALYFGLSITSAEDPIITNKYCEEGETDDVRWVNIKDLGEYDFAFNHDKRIMKFINYIKDKNN